MKILVTGHHGYIGSVTAPALADAGHEVVGLDTFFYRGCDFGAERAAGCHARRSTSAMSPPTHWTASTPSSTSRRSRTTRSATSKPSGRTRSTSTERSRSPARRRRPVSAGSSLPPRARCTARPAGTSSSTRTPHCVRSRRTPSRRSRAEEALRGARRRRLLPDLHAELDRVRGLAPPAARRRPQQPRRLGAHNRKDPTPLGRLRVASARPRAGHRAVRRSHCSRRREMSFTAQAFNVGSAAQNVRIRDLARHAASGCSGARSR